ncbi:MAG: hemerythrin domain-containing protein [Nitrospirota bacterium]
MNKMMPIGPLMIEHRLIERMVAMMGKELNRLSKDRRGNPEFIEAVADFICTYADRCHHGKEEDILFRELKRKSISDEHRRIMDELIEEHKFGRRVIGEMADANSRYSKGEGGALSEIIDSLKTLVELYPNHIDKEDNHFFLPVMQYFSEEEKDVMLAEEYDFDKTLFHELYKEQVAQWEKLYT